MEGSHESLVMVVAGAQLHPHQPWEQTCISGHHGPEHGHGQGSLVPAGTGYLAQICTQTRVFRRAWCSPSTPRTRHPPRDPSSAPGSGWGVTRQTRLMSSPKRL